MAGGKGERFWPLSRARAPKQLLGLLGGGSLLQQTVDRILPLVPKDNVFVITNQVQLPEVRRQLRQLPRANLVAEPVVRDTAAAVALGAALVGSRSTTGVMAVLPADHVIREERRFRRVLTDGLRRASQDAVMVTIGIPPTEAATGYGYIEVAELLPQAGARGRPGTTRFHRVRQFVEKPPLERAMEYVQGGRHRWNAGMFLWSYATIMEGLRQHQTALWEASERWRTVAARPALLARVLEREYPGLPRISIDYALMERARNVVVADGDFGWDDLGSWTALMRHLPLDAAGNCVVGQGVLVDSAGNLVFDGRRRRRTPIALVGMRETLCVQTDDAVLLAPLGGAQKVKALVQVLERDPRWRALL
jgi:mannose-1-phosphate guanylyltransferase